ncbi:MAG TPA: energy transducer TonB [Thermoanaerobaculia bacterium]|nr:energy transducer TonB [Thermoanaerobaculia bacterium]
MAKRFLAAAATAILFLLMNACSSGSGSMPPANPALAAERQRTVDRWQRSIRESAELLRDGSYGKSLSIADGVIDEMVDRLGRGDDETKSFGVVLVHKALAHAGLGQEREAVWYWHMAVNLYPELAGGDLSMYGQPGTFLKNHPLPHWGTDPTHEPGTPAANPRDLMVPRNVTDPKLVMKVQPTFPRGARALGVTGVLFVELVIDEKGTVTSARLIKALPAPTLSYTALEAMKRWRFEPRTENETPVKALYMVKMEFKL